MWCYEDYRDSSVLYVELVCIRPYYAQAPQTKEIKGKTNINTDVKWSNLSIRSSYFNAFKRLRIVSFKECFIC